MIYVGDIHCKEKQPHRDASIKFLTWLFENYGDETIVQGGDLFDSSSHHHSFVDEILSILVKFKDFRIVNGNHDYSKIKGSILTPFQNFDNITVYTEPCIDTIDGLKCYVLPFIYTYKDYENIEMIDEVDCSFSHFTPSQEAFSDEGVDLPFDVRIAHFFSHIHRGHHYIDNRGNNLVIAGAVMNTRYGEQDWKKQIYKITKEGYTSIDIPEYFTYETVKFGEFPTSDNNIINITDAPDISSIYSMYKGFHIRESGIELLRTENDLDGVETFDSFDIKDQFIIFSKENSVAKEITDTALERMDR